MPYNSSAIPPSEEVTGHSSLPLARVKKIIKLDDDVTGCSNSAAFLVTVAAEMFVQYLAEQGLKMTYNDRKQRKTMQYKDLATAVSRVENLEFLADVIPPTVPYKTVRERRGKAGGGGSGEEGVAEAAQGGLVVGNGQRVLPVGAPSAKVNGRRKGVGAVNGGGGGDGGGGSGSGSGRGRGRGGDGGEDKGRDLEMV